MCGIAGIVETEGRTPKPEVLGAMASRLAHRGPNDSAVRTYGRAGFGFRRLSIIDVASGAQPIDNESGTCHVVVNGEIYNHVELRRDLESRGHRFRTRSDAEVIVHGYEEFGDDIVGRLRGMFALALWDDERRRLLLARDRFGKKPLLYREEGERLVFASEFEALLADPDVPREADLVSIHHYLTYQYVPTPLTAFKGVRKLAPAHVLVFEGGRARISRYWQLSSRPALRVDETEAAQEVRRLLREAVRMRLMSDVPLGAFLSGGLDSSAVVALMSEFQRVKTFSIGFDEPAFDETRYAQAVATRYGTDHHAVVVRPQAVETLQALVERFGEPFADASALPTYALAKLASEHVTVALSGDGGDELFAGYDRYLRVAAPTRGLGPALSSTAARAAAAVLPRSGFSGRLLRYAETFSGSTIENYARTISYFRPEEKEQIYSDPMREAIAGVDSYNLLYRVYEEADAEDALGRVLQVDARTYLADDLLVKVDITSMAHSLEVRAPFLDHPLAEFVARLPSILKMRGGVGKRVLRRAFQDLPAEVLSRPKMGFGVPVARWFRHDLHDFLRDVLLSTRAAARPCFSPAAVRRLMDEHQRGAVDHSARLWALLMLELWWTRFLDGGRPAATSRLSGHDLAEESVDFR